MPSSSTSSSSAFGGGKPSMTELPAPAADSPPIVVPADPVTPAPLDEADKTPTVEIPRLIKRPKKK